MEISNTPLENHRNWLELPREITLTILKKIAISEILESAQFVCKLWYILCKEPSMWRSIRICDVKKPSISFYKTKVLRCAADRSNGGLIDLDIQGFYPPSVFSQVISRCTGLKRLRLAKCVYISVKALVEALEKLSCLEELELTLCSFGNEEAVSVIKSCPSITTFRFNNRGSKSPFLENDEKALAIAANMPQLCHLQLIGNNMSNVGLTAILDGCRRLQSLDLRACFLLDLAGDLGRRLSEQIKDLRRPYDSTEDYNYPTTANDHTTADLDFQYLYELDEDYICWLGTSFAEI
ncbi:F-box protein SKIP19-like [Silene latifolia]|uniref:F-box protein SKIP19-like n=1 Tax=Silene latifolia TaxID=37657 RepID=UPI003D78395E